MFSTAKAVASIRSRVLSLISAFVESSGGQQGTISVTHNS